MRKSGKKPQKGAALTQKGTDMFLSALKLPKDTHVYFGTYFNDPAFLAGSITQCGEGAYVAIFDGKSVLAISREKDLKHFAGDLMKEKGKGRTSYRIFLEDVVPRMK